MNQCHVFCGLENVVIEGECFDCSQDIADVCCLAGHVFILLKNQAVYHGIFVQENDGVPSITMLNKLALEAVNIANNSNTLFITTKSGKVFKYSGENFDVPEEVIVKEDSKCCIHGYQTVGHNIKVKAVAASENGCLYVTDNGQLWASGDYIQLGLHCDEPKRVTFFDNRFVEFVACGADFSLAVVHKSRQPTHEKDDTDTEVGDDNEVFVSSCPTCVSECLLTPLSQHSLTPDQCPLGLPVHNSSEEHYSSSTASKDNSADDKKSTDESTSVSMRDETILKEKRPLQRDNSINNQIGVPLGENDKKNCQSEGDVTASDLTTGCDDETAEKKNEFFINTEAARQFLTRQLSWVSSYGGASEELLAECAEASIVRPTRLLKQNVSNMASLVYEGVKNVGDRVVTLSRHMSGGSEETNEMSTEKLGESFEELNCDMVPAGSIASSLSKCDDFPWSSSADTSDQGDKSELGVTGKASAMAQVGAGLLSTELWSWGNISHGQLGLGDTIKRHMPSLVSHLSGLGVCQIACGLSHALVRTLDGRAFAWGENNVHQVTFESVVDQSGPVQITGLGNAERVCGIAAGTKHSIITSHKGNVYYLGKHSNGPVPGMATINVPSHSESISQKCVFASGNISICQVRKMKIPSAIKDLTIEQSFLEETLLVRSALIKQLHKQDTIITSLSEEISVYEKLCSCYNEVVNITALNVKALQTFTERGGDGGTIPFFHNVSEHIQVYWNYLDAVCNVIAISGFAHIAQSVDVSQKLFSICPDIPPKKNKKSIESIVSHALLHPLNRLNIYKCMIVSLFHCHTNKQQILDGKSQPDSKFHESLAKWEHLWEEQERRKKEADATRLFWEGSGRLVELLRCPTRRLIRESRTDPITLFNSGRFSLVSVSHWLVLLSDVLVHVSGSSHTPHPLTTVWVEPLQDTETQQNALLVTVPEDSLTLCCPTPKQKAEWLQALQSAINRRLHKSASHPSAVVRTATYHFLKHTTFKDATYTGRWSSGKLHGVGKLEWPDGRVYVGKFHMNQQSGFGRMEVPSVSIFEGQWKDGQQNGYGMMKYTNGDIYEGYFKDGVPHGHGVHKQGHFTASVASVYIGEWVNGVKQGYGVMDDIITGEKYLGTWNNNLKHGSGLIVTLDGIYYEGNFLQDILTGYGVMVFEDGTHYEGELKGIGFFNGKGTLTFLSGDSIEGTLYGNWNEGVKISGTFHKNQANPPAQLTSNPNSFGKLCVSPDKKWKAIFRQCYLQLGLTEHNGKSIIPDTQKIWDSVAVLISNSYQESSQRPRGIASKEFLSMDKLDTIPQFGRVSLDKESYRELRSYLFKAFESNHHPLGKLLAEVSSAYTATYGGVRVHPLLLSHAVSELHSLTSRVYEVVQLLFPALPAVGEEILLPSGNAGEQDSETISSAALLHPVLLPRVHSALFVLYALHNKREDDAYWKRLLKWNKQPDITLLAFLGIDQKFWFNYTSQSQSPRNGESTFSPCQQRLFTEAVETLQQLKTTFSPMEKLLVIRNTFQQMTHVVQQQLGNTYLWTMDDLFPVFHFVVIRSQILQLGSEIHFIEDFMEPHLQNGELGIMFTTLKACYYQILQEKSSMSL